MYNRITDADLMTRLEVAADPFSRKALNKVAEESASINTSVARLLAPAPPPAAGAPRPVFAVANANSVLERKLKVLQREMEEIPTVMANDIAAIGEAAYGDALGDKASNDPNSNALEEFRSKKESTMNDIKAGYDFYVGTGVTFTIDKKGTLAHTKDSEEESASKEQVADCIFANSLNPTTAKKTLQSVNKVKKLEKGCSEALATLSQLMTLGDQTAGTAAGTVAVIGTNKHLHIGHPAGAANCLEDCIPLRGALVQ